MFSFHLGPQTPSTRSIGDLPLVSSSGVAPCLARREMLQVFAMASLEKPLLRRVLALPPLMVHARSLEWDRRERQMTVIKLG